MDTMEGLAVSVRTLGRSWPLVVLPLALLHAAPGSGEKSDRRPGVGAGGVKIAQRPSLGVAPKAAPRPAGTASGFQIAPAGARIAPPRPAATPPPRAAPGEILVQWDSWFAPARRRLTMDRIGAKFRRRGYRNTFEVLALPPGRTVDAAITLLRRTPGVRIAEPNYYVFSSAAVNDPYFKPYQWNFADTGFGIRAETAWNVSRGENVVVAVIDTGVAYENFGGLTAAPDLSGTRFVPGFDFVDYDTHPQDLGGHGTHVAGTLAQSTNNGMGCAGVAHGASIMPVRVLDKDGRGTMDQVASGIRFAVDNGAKVINLSLGGPSGSAALNSAVQYAAGRDVVVIAAAGNNASITVDYPARYPEVIAVGATRFDGQLASYSNYGIDVDVVAPGGDMTLDQNRDGYPDGILQQMPVPNAITMFNLYFMHGTSMATPHVSGIAALVRSRNPQWSAVQVREAIEKTCRDLGAPGKDAVYGYGLVDAAAAVQFIPPDTAPPTAPTGLRSIGTTPDTVSLAWNVSADNVAVVGYRVYRGGVFAATVAGPAFVDTKRAPATSYHYYVVAYDAADNVSAFSNDVTVTTPPLFVPTPDTTPPSAPTGLVATAVTAGSLTLIWNPAWDNVGVTGYRIYRNAAAVANTAGTTFADSGLTPASSYDYVVVAVDAANNVSVASEPLRLMTSAAPPVVAGGAFDFEDGTTQGWRTLSTRASVDNRNVVARSGSRSLGIQLYGVSTRSKAVVSVNFPSGAASPRAGQTLSLWLYQPIGSRFQARAVLYDAGSTPHYSDYVDLSSGGWTQLKIPLPAYFNGTASRLDLQIGTSLLTSSGTIHLDNVGW